MSTLSVDELVWGTAQTENGSTTVTVHRAAKGEPARQQITVIEEKAGGDAVTSGMQPLFEREAAGSGSDMGSAVGSGSAERPRPKSFFDTKERKIAVGAGAASAVFLIIGFSYWSAEGGLQDQIDMSNPRTTQDFADLNELEDRAASKALWGNICVGLGIAAGAVSGYYFYTDHKKRSETVIAPVPTEDGAGVKLVLGGRW
jgi:hypothetical protein